MIKLSMEDYLELSDSSGGVCLACSELIFGGIEPDAENYSCEYCGEDQVQGIENALIEGNVDVMDVEEEEATDV